MVCAQPSAQLKCFCLCKLSYLLVSPKFKMWLRKFVHVLVHNNLAYGDTPDNLKPALLLAVEAD